MKTNIKTHVKTLFEVSKKITNLSTPPLLHHPPVQVFMVLSALIWLVHSVERYVSSRTDLETFLVVLNKFYQDAELQVTPGARAPQSLLTDTMHKFYITLGVTAVPESEKSVQRQIIFFFVVTYLKAIPHANFLVSELSPSPHLHDWNHKLVFNLVPSLHNCLSFDVFGSTGTNYLKLNETVLSFKYFFRVEKLELQVAANYQL